MRIVASSNGEEWAEATNARIASAERLGRWVAAAESVVHQLLSSGREYERSEWLRGGAYGALSLLRGLAAKELGAPAVPSMADFLRDEPAAAEDTGAALLRRIDHALAIAQKYEVARWADYDWELRLDFESLWRELDEWAAGGSGR